MTRHWCSQGGGVPEPVPIDVYESSAGGRGHSFLAGSPHLRILVDKYPAAGNRGSKARGTASFAELAPMSLGSLGDEVAGLATAAAPVARISVEPGEGALVMKPCAVVEDGAQKWKTESC